MITDTEVEHIIASMPDGEAGFLKTWGLRQFGRAASAFILRRISDMTLLQIVDAARPKDYLDTLPETGKSKTINAGWLATILSKCPIGSTVRAYEVIDNNACGQQFGLEILNADGTVLACIHDNGGLTITPEGKRHLTPRSPHELII